MRRAGSPNYSGSVLQNQFAKSVKECAGKVFRIPDSTFVSNGVTLSRKSIADFWVFVPSMTVIRVVLAECKAEGGKSIAFDRLAPHQEDALLDMQETHEMCFGVVVVNFYDATDVRKSNRLFMVPIKVWREARDRGERKSMPIAECENDERIVECPRMGTVWNLRPWVACLEGK